MLLQALVVLTALGVFLSLTGTRPGAAPESDHQLCRVQGPDLHGGVPGADEQQPARSDKDTFSPSCLFCTSPSESPGFSLSCHVTLCRDQSPSRLSSLHQVCDPVPAHPVAPVRPTPLLLCDDGEGAEEVARRAAGLCPALQQR